MLFIVTASVARSANSRASTELSSHGFPAQCSILTQVVVGHANVARQFGEQAPILQRRKICTA